MAQPKLSALQSRIAGQIIEHAIEHDMTPGSHLNELGLASEFGVSRSPVAAALRFLASRGILEARPNHGFFLKVPTSRLRSVRTAIPDNENDRLYESIVADRVGGKLGVDLSESELMRRYGASRGMLRRVLQRLAQEDIVERSEGYGWSFRPSLESVEAHDESYYFRLIVEPAGILSPTFALDERRLAGVQRAHEQMLETEAKRVSRRKWFEMNSDFHVAIAEWSQNRFVLQSIQQQNRLRRLLEYRGFIDPKRAVTSCQEHLAILAALRTGERAWAAQLMTRHLEVASKLKLAFGEG